jgi:hypothetical protein
MVAPPSNRLRESHRSRARSAHLLRPRTWRHAADLFFAIVDIATGEVEDPDPDDGKDPAAVGLGRKGGLKGGKARAQRMTPAQRSDATRRSGGEK